mgnify:CR=1 FL=1
MVNLNKLTAKQVQTFKADNKQVRYSDGGGLYLCIRPYPDISLAKSSSLPAHAEVVRHIRESV